MKNPFVFNFKCRFHLGKGKNFMHWRIENMNTGEVKFYEPSKVTFTFTNAFLRNQKGAATKIHNGANKTVCAWIECETVEAKELAENSLNPLIDKRITYNPKVSPNWFLEGDNVDGMTFEKIVTIDNKVFTPVNSVDDLLSTYELQWTNHIKNDFNSQEGK